MSRKKHKGKIASLAIASETRIQRESSGRVLQNTETQHLRLLILDNEEIPQVEKPKEPIDKYKRRMHRKGRETSRDKRRNTNS
jgi:hypothetical protein